MDGLKETLDGFEWLLGQVHEAHYSLGQFSLASEISAIDETDGLQVPYLVDLDELLKGLDYMGSFVIDLFQNDVDLVDLFPIDDD